MASRLTTAELTTWRDFLRAHALVVGALEREMQAEHQLPLAWYDVLVQLSEAVAGRLRLQTLAESVLLSRSGLTRLIDRMERSGLGRRTRDFESRRARPPEGGGGAFCSAPVPNGYSSVTNRAGEDFAGGERQRCRRALGDPCPTNPAI